MHESGNDRLRHTRAQLQPERDGKLAARIAERNAAAAWAASSRKGLTITTLDENIRRAVGGLASSGIDIETAARNNAVIFACMSTHAFAFSEPYLGVLDAEKTPAPDHPALAMLRAMPNGMSESELMRYAIVHMASGGCRLKKNRHEDRRVLGLTPYHRNQVRPVLNAGRADRWVKEWEYVVNGRVADVWAPEDVIALDWPLPDLGNPGRFLAPLDAIAAEFGQDNEMTRYATALLENDAVARTIITMPRPPEGLMTLGPDAKEDTRELWRESFSGVNRGGVAVLDPGQVAQRLGLDLQELAFDALRRVPESRICAAFRIPPQMVGVTAGLDSGTYANYAEARRAYTQGTLVPLWRYVSDQLTRGLAADFGDAKTARWEFWHVLTDVAALQEDANAAAARQAQRSARIQELQTAYQSGAMTREMAIANATIELAESDEDAALLFPEIEAEEKSNELRTTVGGLQALIALQAQVGAGTIAPNAARSLATVICGLSPDEAAHLFPEPPAAPTGTSTAAANAADTTDATPETDA